MIVAHFINPFFTNNKYNYDLLLLKDSNIILRNSISSNEKTPESLLNIANILLNDYCLEFNSNPELLEEDKINYSIEELIIDEPDGEI
jgi:hypothetical protein